MSRRLASLAHWGAWAYLAALAVLITLLWWVGERCWLLVLLLYLPRWLFAVPLFIIVPALLRSRQTRMLWTQAACALLVLFPLMGLTLSYPRRAEGATIRLLSYNVWFGYRGQAAIEQEVLAAAPNIVVFQATSSTAHAALQSPYFRGWDVRRLSAFSIASQFPIRDVSVPPELVSRSGAPFVRFTIETSLGPIDLYAMHPSSPTGGIKLLRRGGLRYALSSGTAAQGIIENAQYREQQVRALVQETRRSRNPVLIAGDTNLPGLSRIYRLHLSAYQDSFAEVGNGFGYTYPAHRFLRWMRIDRILAGPGVRFVRCGVGGRSGSDHSPVYADFALAP